MAFTVRFSFEGKPPTQGSQPSKPAKEELAEIKVARDDFLRGLDNALLALPKGKKTDLDLWIEFHNGEARLHASGVSTEVPAKGRWPGVACVSLRTLKKLRPRVPPGDPLKLTFRDGRLCIQSFCFPATWRALTEVGGSWPLGLPLHPTTLDFVKVGRRYSAEEIERQGLTSAIRAARHALAKAAEQAAEILQKQGVPASLLQAFVESLIADERTETRKGNSKR